MGVMMESYFEYEEAKRNLKILDISSTSIITEDELKKKYLLLAKKYHPDTLPVTASIKEKKDVEEKFKAINNANKYVKAHLYEINEIIGNNNFVGTFDSAIRRAKEEKQKKDQKTNSWNPTSEFHQDSIKNRENIIREKEDYYRQERIKKHLKDIEERGKRDRKNSLKMKSLGKFFIIVIIIFIIFLLSYQIANS
jgi:curved DNA-binding protein CbpA